jgi:5-methylcytosine-specific restriction endonuclease McrA
MDTLAASRTLLLSATYEPLKVISWQRALTLLTLGKVEIIESYDGFARSSTLVIKIPAVVRLLRMFKRFRKPVKFSRATIYARDGYRCQYCGDKKKLADLTYDHVVPRTQGGKTEWRNILTSCGRCNLKKGGRTPAQAGMHPLSVPHQPDWVPALTIKVSSVSVPDAWRDYLYWTSELDQD